MPYTSSPQELREAFVQLPDNVRKWLASEKVLAVVTDMNDRLEYFGDKVSVIPWLITRLAVKDLAPKYFMSELRDYLVVDENEARAITEEIDKRILRPIEPALTRLDIDLNSLYLGQAAPATAEEVGNKKYEVRGGEIGAPRQFGVDVPEKPTPNLEPPTSNIPEGPVILHTEKEEISQIAHEKPGATTNMPRPSFSISIPQSKYRKPVAPPPVTVRLETPGNVGSSKFGVGSEKETGGVSTRTPNVEHPTAIAKQGDGPKIMKVVHYSDFRTPLK